MAKIHLYLLSLEAGADIIGLEGYLETRLGIADSAQRKKLIYNSPSLLGEIDGMDLASEIKRQLDGFGARVEFKPATRVQRPQATAAPTPASPSPTDAKRPPVNRPLYGVDNMMDLPPMTDKEWKFPYGKAFMWGLGIAMAGILLWEVNVLLKHISKTSEISNDPVVVSDDGFKGNEIQWRLESRKKGPAPPVFVEGNDELIEIEKLIKQGSLGEAAEILEERVNADPEDTDSVKMLAHVYWVMAGKAYEGKDYMEAINHLIRANEIDPERADILGQLGFLYFNRKDYGNAEYYLDEALRYGSGSADAHYILANIYYYHRDDLDLAVRHLDKAIEAAPERSELVALRDKIEKEKKVEENMSQTSGGKFIVKYDGLEDEDAGYTVLYTLEEAYSAIGYDLGEYPPDPITVILYTRRQFREVTNAPHWAGGLYDGRIRLPASGLPDRNDDDLKRLLYHEYTHAVVHRITGGKCPVWLNEGIAQVMQERAGTSKDPWLKVEILQRGAIMTLGSLSRPFVRMDGINAQIAYIESYYATQYLIQEYGLSGVRNVLQELGKGSSLDRAFRDVLGVEFRTFEDRFYYHLKTIVE